MNHTVLKPSDVNQGTSVKNNTRKIILWLMYLMAIAVVLVLFFDGYSYYSTPYKERPHHSEYRELRPAGSRGLLYGYIGAGMMILMLVYTFRKRTRLFGRKIPLRPFLDFHIFMGVFGPLLIVLHTSFKVQGLVAVAFWSMVAVALSGYFGRYLYQQLPRNLGDRELTLREINRLVTDLGDELKNQWGLSRETLENTDRVLERIYGIGNQDSAGSITNMVWSDIKRPFLKSSLKRKLRKNFDIPYAQYNNLFEMLTSRALLMRRIAVMDKVQRLFHYWHVIHKPFAIIMYIIVGVHIGVAVWTGYGWF